MQWIPNCPLFLAASLLLLSFSTTSTMVNAASQQQVVDLPNVEIYMVCKTAATSSSSSSNSTKTLSPNDPTGSSQMLELELRDFFQGLLNLSPSTDNALTLNMNSTVHSCIASDAVEAILSSSGTIDWSKLSSNGNNNMTTFYSANELQGMVTKSGLHDALANLCSVVLSFQAKIQAAGSPPQAGWEQNLSRKFCSLTKKPLGVSTLAIVLIVVGGLAVLCLVCCCCRRNK